MRRARAGSEAWGSDSDEDAWADEEGRANLDWRAEEAAGKFSDKQTALARKIKKLTARAEQLRSEAEKIRKKVDSMEDLTPGQASALLRCDQDADRAMEEAEEAEEALLESLNASGRTRGGGAKKRRRRPDDEDEDFGGESSDGKDLYDETQRGSSGKRASKPGSSRPIAQKTVQAEDAASLHARRELLQDRAAELEGEVSKEEVKTKSGAEKGNSFKTAPTDSLDAFMEDVTARAGADKLQTLKMELEGVRQDLAKVDGLIELADPEGYFARSNRLASEALDRAKEALQEQETRRAAQQRAKEREQQQKEEKEARKQAAGSGMAAADAASMPPPPSRIAAVRLDLPPSSAPLPSREDVEGRKKRVAEKLDALRQEEASLGSTAGGLEVRQKKQAALPLQAQVAADLAALRQARGKQVVEEASAEDEQWVPPPSQKGDGRTSLNDRLGY
ncbi:hypothetical protein H632_c894p0 [Helicosporidium sp. ATCC 50920]|nr:hypothetical protein H632_c894p0 [Helicosporidium sp. ATCC 50920]|eukprot:KDD75063.1 hypothetical protein H632_c894p0 [Helicosporidium sp. ATCC 50920]